MLTKEFLISSAAMQIDAFYQSNLILLPEYPLTRAKVKRWYWSVIKKLQVGEQCDILKLFDKRIAEQRKNIDKCLKGAQFIPQCIGTIEIAPRYIIIKTIEHPAITYRRPENAELNQRFINKVIKQYSQERCVHIDLDTNKIYTKLDISK